MTTRARTWTFLSFLVVLYVASFFALDGLAFPPTKDETHFWPTTVAFSREFPPSLDTLRHYNELNTPLPFVVFGAVEHFFQGGIAAGRLVNLLLSFVILCVVGFAAGPPTGRAWLAVAGLLAFPYFLGTAAYFYTDIMAAFFVVGGVAFRMKGRHASSALFFILAIASRQYAIAFPAAFLAWEIVLAVRTRSLASRGGLWAALAASASLAAWYAFFGGFAPPVALKAQGIDTSRMFVDHGLYFLSCVGLYFVLVEAVLFRRIFLPESRRTAIVLAVATVILFVAFPPLQNVDYLIPTMGLLDRAVRVVLDDTPRVGFFAVLAACAAWRFSRLDLASLFVWVNALVMIKAHIAWDKYALSLLVVLWYLKAAGMSGDGSGTDQGRIRDGSGTVPGASPIRPRSVPAQPRAKMAA